MDERSRVLLLIPRLNAGGAARVTTRVAGGLAECGYDVHLAVATGEGYGAFLAGATVHWLGASRVRHCAWGLIRLVRRLRPEVILSNMMHLNLLVLALRPAFPRGTRILVRNDGGVHPEQLTWLRLWACRFLHSTSDAVICQSYAMSQELAAALGCERSLLVLPNPVPIGGDTHEERGDIRWRAGGPNLLAIGRLEQRKGFDLLLEAFAAISARFPGAQLAMVGDGPERGNLAALAAELGIANRVQFKGEVADPERWFAGATVFVLASREDAMPNALLEAAAAGLPIVATPARGAVPALLARQPGTWVANDVSTSALAASLAEALASLAPGQRFEHVWMEPFAWDNAIADYADLIRSVARHEP
jgi:glycosyltransferase involved in cell wall biosynthesis